MKCLEIKFKSLKDLSKTKMDFCYTSVVDLFKLDKREEHSLYTFCWAKIKKILRGSFETF